jgi:outer membrane protein
MKSGRFIVLLLLSLLGAAGQIRGQDPGQNAGQSPAQNPGQTLEQSPGQTLEECLALARSHAPLYLAAQADSARAEEVILEARAALLPSVKLSAGYLQNSEAPKSVIPIPGSPAPVVIQTGNASQLDARTEGQWVLYSGGRNTALLQAAQEARNEQGSGCEQVRADLTLRVSQAFYRAVATQKLASAAGEAVASASSHLRISAARVRAGMAPRVDSLRAAVDLASRSSAWLRARENVRSARLDLETAVGAPLDTTRALVLPGGPESSIPEAEAEVRRGLSSRPELTAYDQSLRETSLRLTAARGARLPQVSLSATAQYLGPNLNDDYLDLKDPGLKTYRLYAGVNLSMPLFDGGLANARAGELTAQERALQERRHDLELAVRREVLHSISDLKVAVSVWPSNSSRIAFAREALRLAEAGYKDGTSTDTEVRDAEAALSDAQAEEAQTLMDYWMARAALDHATGASRKEN